MIIDIHAHTSTKPLWGLHTADASLDAIEAQADRHGIGKVVLMATCFPLKGKEPNNGKLLDLIFDRPRFSLFGTLDMTGNLERGLSELSSFAKTGQIAGIKMYPGYQDFHPSAQAAFSVYEVASRYNLPVAFHGGELHHCCPEQGKGEIVFRCGKDYCQLDRLQYLSHPLEIRDAAKAYPGVKFVISHLGNPYFDETRQLMAECPNVFTDISGQFVSGRQDEDTPEYRSFIVSQIREFLALPGVINRLMFGTDFPIMSYPDAISLIDRLDLDEQSRDLLMSQNARFLLDRTKEVF